MKHCILRIIRRYELPTWAVLAVIYTGWACLIGFWHRIPLYIASPIGALLLTWFGSLQHEVIHCHPTRNQKLNDWLVALPIWLWVPFQRYKASHLAHHRKEIITCPVEDPESFYVTPETWRNMARWQKKFLMLRNTLPGRLIAGPLETLIVFYRNEMQAIRAGKTKVMRAWQWHGAGVVIVVAILLMAGINPLVYFALLVYPSISLTLLRSYAEHKFDSLPEHRNGIIEAGLFWRLLYLNNNYHALHHDCPCLPWYELPDKYEAERDSVLARNDYYYIPGYSEIVRKYMFRIWNFPIRRSQR